MHMMLYWHFVLYCVGDIISATRVTNLVVIFVVQGSRVCMYNDLPLPICNRLAQHRAVAMVLLLRSACLSRNSRSLATVSKLLTQYQYKLVENTGSCAILDCVNCALGLGQHKSNTALLPVLYCNYYMPARPQIILAPKALRSHCID